MFQGRAVKNRGLDHSLFNHFCFVYTVLVYKHQVIFSHSHYFPAFSDLFITPSLPPTPTHPHNYPVVPDFWIVWEVRVRLVLVSVLLDGRFFYLASSCSCFFSMILFWVVALICFRVAYFLNCIKQSDC